MNFSAIPVGGGGAVIGVTLPDIAVCPLCHHAILAVLFNQGIYAADASNPQDIDLQVILQCPRRPCHRLFIARYGGQVLKGPGSIVATDWELLEVTPRSHQTKDFPNEVKSLSSRFIEIFDQSAAAEAAGLDQICGPGYGKALEFLIKDYLKSIAEDDTKKEAIEKEQLGACIANRVTDPRLKSTASRAAWLRNDETHYVRKWTDKDLSDLKKLIDLTVHWISWEILTNELEASMPDPKKGKP